MRPLLLCLLAAVCVVSCSSETPRSTPAEPSPAATPAVAPPGPRLLVTNERSGNLTVIDVTRRDVIATVPLGKRPRGIRVSPDRATAYVALSGSPIAPPGVDERTLPPPDRSADGIGVVDLRTLALHRVIPAGTDPEQLAVSNDGRRMFVANEDASAASIVELPGGRILSSVRVGGEPEGVEVRPDGAVVYVTSEEDNEVFVIDTADSKVVATFEVAARPRSIAFLPDSSRAYITCENGGAVVVADAIKHIVLNTITLRFENARPMGAVVSADGRSLYVSTGRGRHVAIIDTATNTTAGTIEVGPRPWGIALSPDGRTLYTANGPSNDVSVVDLATRTVTARIAVGEGPWGLAVVP